MKTNDEIIKEHDLEGDGDLGIDVNEALNQARAEGYKEGQTDMIKKLEELVEDIYGKYIGDEHIEKTKGRRLGVIECIVLLNGKCTIQDRIEVPEE